VDHRLSAWASSRTTGWNWASAGPPPPQAGTLLGGLFFIAFMKNPSQFVKLQTALAADALNEYIHHTGSAVFAVPPGLHPGQHYGDALFS
jgi:deferrochelatase/peroxidase EfeB